MTCRFFYSARTAFSKVSPTKAQMRRALLWGRCKISAVLLAIGLIVSINHEFDFVMALFTSDLTLSGLIVIAAILLLFGHEMPELMLNVAVVIETIAVAALALSSGLRWLNALYHKWFGGGPDDTSGASVVTP
ncbi:hypothetical protein [Pleomorphomonas koreensis]|uniref:hypothetical protein n=1 Tax=Pleomorphomonas koreensis TaxID=257440 RepID=UPI00047DCF2D|nr:hypothetical protein [Pleomorphomonas koreensis]